MDIEKFIREFERKNLETTIAEVDQSIDELKALGYHPSILLRYADELRIKLSIS